MERGFAIITRANSAQALTDTAGLRAGDRIRARLAHGTLEAEVRNIIPGDTA
jgi:exonuclease VII large subunit